MSQLMFEYQYTFDMLRIGYAYVLYPMFHCHLLNIQQFYLMFLLLTDKLLLLNKVMFHPDGSDHHRLISIISKNERIFEDTKKIDTNLIIIIITKCV